MTKLKFLGKGEVRVQSGMVLKLKNGDVVDLPYETAKDLMKRNPDFKILKPEVKKIEKIKLEEENGI